ncbi:type II toxin-antitoxin system VapC family toxin [Mucilaginibacter arboris]|uniref:PIN domain-containing protein n=1 Tax=Mucilaginibacter arboris TaxID=2682090 RepID=A0A7K1SVG2_9SPHI|nr:PIN domain-containing protein [Mucilaginibacter arboris]MVN21311.1 PIN domain-containing protein [Mucilaginibacter arboris]
MERVFVDTDICLDLLSGRKPFNSFAEQLFSLADKKEIEICVSALSFSTIDYILHAQYAVKNPRQLIAKFKTLVTTLSVESRTIDLAIASDFDDFEDAIQYNTAIENEITVLITRNIKDYKAAQIKVITSESYLVKNL